jgi:hypothetical protein
MPDSPYHIITINNVRDFIKKVNEKNEGVIYELKPDEYKYVPNKESVHKNALEVFNEYNITALYTDMTTVIDGYSLPQTYPSYHIGIFDDGMIIQSPIFILGTQGTKIQHNPLLNVCHGHDILRQMHQHTMIFHMPLISYHFNIADPQQILRDIEIINDSSQEKRTAG